MFEFKTFSDSIFRIQQPYYWNLAFSTIFKKLRGIFNKNKNDRSIFVFMDILGFRSGVTDAILGLL